LGGQLGKCAAAHAVQLADVVGGTHLVDPSTVDPSTVDPSTEESTPPPSVLALQIPAAHVPLPHALHPLPLLPHAVDVVPAKHCPTEQHPLHDVPSHAHDPDTQ
jgi:hypothetical protein